MPHSRLRRAAAAVRDVTGRKRAEDLVRQSDAKYAAAFTASPNPFAIARRSDSVLLEVNEAWERVTGYERGKAIGRSSLELGIWADPEDRSAAIARLDAERRLLNHPARFVRADGRAFDVLLSAVNLPLNGEPCILWSWSDVSDLREFEARARQSLQKYAAVFETSPDGIAVMRLSDGLLIEANDAGLAQLGLSRDAALGRSVLDLNIGAEPAERERILARLRADGRIANHPVKIRRRDGSWLHMLLSAVRIRLDDETCIVWSWRDLSDLLVLERAALESEWRYRMLFDAAQDGIVIATSGAEILAVNPAILRMTGFTREEIEGKPLARLFGGAGDPPLDTTPFERSLQRKDGSTLVVEATLNSLPDGNLLFVMRDVSERKRAEALVMEIARGVSAQTGEDFFQSLVAQLAAQCQVEFAFVGELVAPENTVVRTRAFYARGEIAPNFEYALDGSPCAEGIARPGTVAIPERAAALYPRDAGLSRRGIEGYVGTSLFSPSGFPLGIMVVMSRSAIRRPEFCASLLEIFAARAAAEVGRARSEAEVRAINLNLEARVRERTAELEAANRDLESFNYSISHDLRGPLGAINGFAHLLRANEGARLSADGATLLEHLEKNAARAVAMADALLEFSRLGRKPVRKVAVAMGAIVEDVLQTLRTLPAAARAEFRVGELPDCRGDPVLLRQVWSNLLGNALKYSRQRDAALIEIGYEAASGAYVVRDNGVGFDARHAEKLFHVFERLHSEAEFEGAGVGLAIVRRIIERHGGSVGAEGSRGNGATFRFSLPE
jgi:PAS domain S-box-containing protein